MLPHAAPTTGLGPAAYLPFQFWVPHHTAFCSNFYHVVLPLSCPYCGFPVILLWTFGFGTLTTNIKHTFPRLGLCLPHLPMPLVLLVAAAPLFCHLLLNACYHTTTPHTLQPYWFLFVGFVCVSDGFGLNILSELFLGFKLPAGIATHIPYTRFQFGLITTEVLELYLYTS